MNLQFRGQRTGVRVGALAVLLTGAAALLISQNTDLPAVPADDPVLKAMRDEMDRSRQLRVVGGGEVPYFYSYSLTDADNLRVSASLGASYNVSRQRFRSPSIEEIGRAHV